MRTSLRSWGKEVSVSPLQPLTALETTVLVPCYNHERFLPLMVHSLVQQTVPRFDTVLIDDCSTDGTAGLLEGLSRQLAGRGSVRLIRHDVNRGQAATLNEACGLAETALVSVVNDDDWLTPTALQVALEAHRELGDIAMIGSASRWFTGEGPPPDVSAVPHGLPRRLEPAQVQRFRRVNDLNMTHSGMTVRREAWAAVGGYRSDPAQRVVPFSDRDFQLRIAARYPIALIDAPLVWWRSDSSVDAGLNS